MPWEATFEVGITRQTRRIDPPTQPPLQSINQNEIVWDAVDESSKSKIPSQQIIWEVLSEQDSNLTDEELTGQINSGTMEPVVIPASPLQALDRSIAFEDGFVGPDISWNVPNGLRWSQRWFGSASFHRQSRRKSDESFYQWKGGDDLFIVHANILQSGSWSAGLNMSIRSFNATQTQAVSESQLGKGLSSGFRISTSIGDTAGIAFGGEQVVQWDDNTDTGRNLYLMATKGWWLGDQIYRYPLLIANGGIGTGRYANQDILVHGSIRSSLLHKRS